jgi:SOS-response transcriptional repressor LexA
MNLGIRLKQARLKKKLTQEELAEIVGIKQQAVQRIEAGKVRSTSYVVQLAKALNVSPEWLALGEGNELNAATSEEQNSNHQSQTTSNPAPLLEWDDTAIINHTIAKLEDTKLFPVFSNNHGQCFALEVRDNSMTEADGGQTSFLRGDILIVDALAQPHQNDFVLAKLPASSHVTFRQYISDDTGAYLKPLNSQYSTVRINPEVKICGVVIARYSNFN